MVGFSPQIGLLFLNMSFWPTYFETLAPESLRGGPDFSNFQKEEPPQFGLVSEEHDRFGPLFCGCMWYRHVHCYVYMGSLLALDKEKGS